MPKNSRISVQRIAMIAMLIAVQIVLSRFLAIQTPITKISFGFIPTIIASRYFGIAEGVLVGGIGDFLGSTIFPVYPYFVGYTITAVIRAIIIGLFISKKVTLPRLVIAILITEIFCSILLNNYWNAYLGSGMFLAMLPARFVQSAIMIPVQIIIMHPILVKYENSFKRVLHV